MKLFIYDKFWDAFIKLSKETQQATRNFIEKFQQNSKSAAIHLEPISSFKDKTLRTARVSQKYRAILKEVVPDDLYLFLWIDNHDEAMDWAKNKLISWNERTQAYQVITVDETPDTLATNQNVIPLPQLFMGKYPQSDLLEIGVPEILMPSVLKAQDINDLEKLESYLPVDAFENLFCLLDGGNIDVLKTEIKEGAFDEIASKNNARSFIELTDNEMLNEALQGSLHKWKYYLHPSQSSIVNADYKGPIKLSGGAGTGKTVAALHRLKYLAKNKSDQKPILFTTFTKDLSDNLRELATALEIPTSSYEVHNIDHLAFAMAKEYNLLDPAAKIFGLNTQKDAKEIWMEVLDDNLTELDESFLIDEFEEVVLVQNLHSKEEYLKASRVGRGKAISKKQRIEVWNLIEQFKEKKGESKYYYKEEVFNLVSTYLKDHEIKKYAHVIVDELQDFTNVELNYIRALAPEGMNDLFLVGDPLQNIYRRKINFSKAGINIRGNRSKRLRINYRTTEEINKLAFSLVSKVDFDDFDGNSEDKTGYLSLFHGMMPTYKLYWTKQQELESVTAEIKQLLQQGVRYEEILIAARRKDCVNDFRNHLHQHNIPHVDKKLLTTKSEGIRLGTFHGIKGLEFKHVFLVDVNDRTLPYTPTFIMDKLTEEEKAQYLKSEKALFYVAISRAIHKVNISGVGTPSNLIPASITEIENK